MTEKEDDRLEKKIKGIVIDNLIEAFQRIQDELKLLKEGEATKVEQLDVTVQEPSDTIQKQVEKLEADTKSGAVKLTLAGYGAVGKTTIFKLLKGKGTELSYYPTIGANVDCEDLIIGKSKINVWDLAGQEHYHRTWPIFLRNTKIALIVTDSTRENVEKTKNILNIVKAVEPKAIIVGIANKQDLPNALPPKEVGSMLGIETYPCVAIDTSYREKMIAVIENAITELRRSE
nr:ADP-ribosylation factor-like protein [Candidatus Njordarchaeota archaeon]